MARRNRCGLHGAGLPVRRPRGVRLDLRGGCRPALRRRAVEAHPQRRVLDRPRPPVADAFSPGRGRPASAAAVSSRRRMRPPARRTQAQRRRHRWHRLGLVLASSRAARSQSSTSASRLASPGQIVHAVGASAPETQGQLRHLQAVSGVQARSTSTAKNGLCRNDSAPWSIASRTCTSLCSAEIMMILVLGSLARMRSG